jgi:hypothetical protein
LDFKLAGKGELYAVVTKTISPLQQMECGLRLVANVAVTENFEPTFDKLY